MDRTRRVIAAMALCIAASPGIAEAAPRTFLGTDGLRIATATFDTSGTNLVVSLRNIGPDVLAPDQLLAAVFFTLAGNPVLAPVSAIVPAPSSVLFGGTDPGGVVGGEWAYASGIAAPYSANAGISSSGFGLFGDANFPGGNLQGPVGVDGMQYSLTSASDNPATGNAAVTGANALIRNEVVFTLSGLPAGFDPSANGNVSRVWFQYGTSLTEPGFPNPGEGDPQVPEPASLALLGAAVALAALLRARRHPA
ncbi:MAG: XDD4 family exosortase-dependent surface protein [Alphaproteobacteria bacterium]